jgi:hypothetical protein
MADFQNRPSSFSIGTGIDPNAGVLQKGAASGAPTISNPNYVSPVPQSPPINNISSYSQLYGGNALPSQPYHSFHSSFQQAEPENVRYTPSSLEWGPRGADFVKLYKFIVPKGNLPYLELLDKWTATYQTPSRVYLDEPRQVLPLIISHVLLMLR